MKTHNIFNKRIPMVFDISNKVDPSFTPILVFRVLASSLNKFNKENDIILINERKYKLNQKQFDKNNDELLIIFLEEITNEK